MSDYYRLGFKTVILFWIFTLLHCDPCSDYTSILDENGQSYNNTLGLSNGLSFSDDRLSTQWYKVNVPDGSGMPTFPLDLLKCGTVFPIWLNGSLPDSIGDIATRTVCMATYDGSCGRSWTIRIMYCCDNTYVYELQPSPITDSGYCFGIGVTRTVPGECLDMKTDEVEVDVIDKRQETSGIKKKTMRKITDLNGETPTSPPLTSGFITSFFGKQNPVVKRILSYTMSFKIVFAFWLLICLCAHLTAGYWHHYPAFFVTMHQHPFNLNGIDDVIKFDRVKLNDGEGYNSQTGYFVCPRSGLYHFSAVIVGNESHVHYQLNKNYEAYVLGYSKTGTANSSTISVTVRLHRGDKVFIKHRYVHSKEQVYGYDLSSFSGHFLHY